MRCSQKKAEKKVHIKQSNLKKRSKKYPSYRQFVHEIITTKDMVLRGVRAAGVAAPPCSFLAQAQRRLPITAFVHPYTLLPPPSPPHTHYGLFLLLRHFRSLPLLLFFFVLFSSSSAAAAAVVLGVNMGSTTAPLRRLRKRTA